MMEANSNPANQPQQASFLFELQRTLLKRQKPPTMMFIKKSNRNTKTNNSKMTTPTTPTTTTTSAGSSVILENIDDYIAPSQACVNPLFQNNNDNDNNNDDDTNNNNNVNKKKNDLGTTTSTTTVVAAGAVGVVTNNRRQRRRRIVRRDDSSDNNKEEQNNNTNQTNGLIMKPPPPQKMMQEDEVPNTNNNKKQEEKSTSSSSSSIKASIADCLACSGCVTTAETVLLEQRHSLSSLKSRLSLLGSSSDDDQQQKTIIIRAITISPNSWADLCRYWNINQQQQQHESTEYYCKFTTLLNHILHASIVIDGNLPLLWTWVDESKEFVMAYKSKQQAIMMNKKPTKTTKIPNPSFAINSQKTSYYQPNGQPPLIIENCNDPNAQISQKSSVPSLISGSCPALVCLVEKSWNSLVPYLSHTQSSMSRMGNTLEIIQQQRKQQEEVDDRNEEEEEGTSNNNNNTNNNAVGVVVWDHWSIMPCHDKKLEASRQDFVISESKKSDKDDNNRRRVAVDLVITTQELVELVEEWIMSQQQQQQNQQQQKGEEEENKSTTTTTRTRTTSTVNVVDYLNAMQPANHVSISTPGDFEKEIQQRVLGSSTTTAATTTATTTTPTLITAATTMTSSQQQQQSDEQEQQNQIKKQIAYSSGGHADFIFRYAAKELFNYDITDVQWKPVAASGNPTKNGKKKIRSARLAKKYAQQQQQSHYYEAKLYHNKQNGTYSQQQQQQQQQPGGGCTTGTVSSSPDEDVIVLHFTIVHGMQTLQRALKELDDEATNSSSSPNNNSIMQYIEAMACPYGCVNGGGSIVRSNMDKAAAGGGGTTTSLLRETPTETRQRVQKTVSNLSVPSLLLQQQQPSSSSSQKQVVIEKYTQNLYTRYHVVPPMQHTMGAAAGVKVEDMQW